jgi:protein-L-isoaspartate(D-aspartate) O-methyltransferase
MFRFHSHNALKLYVILAMTFFSCSGHSESQESDAQYQRRRLMMVANQIEHRGVKDEKVLQAMREVPRHLFVPEEFRGSAYTDGPLPIGQGQTISQPYIVAVMTELLSLDSTSKVLEIGTGSGYQAAVLAEICDSVYSIEIIPSLAKEAAFLLDSLGYCDVQIKAGDGYLGWPEAAPFDAIIITAAAPRVPQPLVEQLKRGGRMVIPVGNFSQELMLFIKTEKGLLEKSVIPVRFVPMTGKIQERK